MDSKVNVGMVTIETEITPSMAKEWLGKIDRANQRPVMPLKVELYAKEMALGHWVTHHQGIGFDTSGALCDGQQRLNAIVKSGCTVRMNVTRGIPVKQGNLYTIDAMDRGANRSLAQQLNLRHGVKNACRVSAAARIIAMICKRSTCRMTVANTLAVLDRFGHSIEVVSSALHPTPSMFTASVLGSLAFCYRAMPKQLDDFIVSIGSGENLSRGMPAFTLRAYILANKVDSGVLNGHERPCCLCAMHHVLGNRLTLIKSTNTGVDFFHDKQPRIADEVASMF